MLDVDVLTTVRAFIHLFSFFLHHYNANIANSATKIALRALNLCPSAAIVTKFTYALCDLVTAYADTVRADGGAYWDIIRSTLKHTITTQFDNMTSHNQTQMLSA